MKKEMLVIDDEPMLCKALGALFTRRGFRVTTATTAQDALDSLQRITADVVLLDLKLPDASGLEVLTLLKERLPDVRIVIISGVSDPATIQEALDRGANDYLPKPFDFDHCFYVAMGVETVDLSSTTPEPDALAELSGQLAVEYKALPVAKQDGVLRVAMADPLNKERVAELEARLEGTIKPLAVTGGDLTAAIQHYYAGEAATPATAAPAGEPSPRAAILLDQIVQHALSAKATDVHVGQGAESVWVRERIDGVMADAPVPEGLQAQFGAFISHVKQQAGLDPVQRRLPQQGRVHPASGPAKPDLRISIVPTSHGEHVAMRLVTASQMMKLDQIGLLEEQRTPLAGLLAKPSGLILITGPAGAGISTSLYALLSKANTGKSQIVTVEDPIEHDLTGVTQIPVHPHGGLTFAQGLEAALQHDPDIIMVGELPDQETSQSAVRAALTGRLVLSNLRTNDASSAITRLLDFGVEPFFLCSTLSAILSQRLLRKLCADCREAHEVDAAALATIGLSLPKTAGTVKLWRAKGCKRCRQTGYLGRAAIFELLTVDHQIRSLIIKRTSGIQIRQSAVARGMVTLLHSAWQAVQVGATSLEELVRVLPRDHA
jgi:type II secretory ATPase GspE/PulE/Tfp pilus assembly ATPase PilB-like protein